MRFFVLVLICGLLCSTVATLTAPHLLSWYASPPVPIGVTCDLAISWGMNKLILAQVLGLGVGAAIGALLSFKFRYRPTAGPLKEVSTRE